MQITDGFGSSAKMQVDKFGRGRVFANTATQETHATDLGVAFHFNTNGEIAIPAAFNGYLMFVKNNNPNATLSVQNVVSGCSAAGLRIDIYRNPVLGSLANDTPISGINNKFSSAATANTTAAIWDGVSTGITGITGGDLFQPRILGVGPDDNPIAGSVNIDAENTIAFWVNNPTGAAIRMTLDMRGFFKETGTPKSVFE